MAQDLNKSFEQEKIENDLSSSIEKPGLDIEKSDQIKEVLVEKEGSGTEKSGEEKKVLEKTGEAMIASNKKPAVSITSPDLERQKQIDQILSEGLDEIFLSLTPIEQKKFREEGERTVLKINELLTQAKVKIKKIINLIKMWLKIIPKVNSHFLEQEAKIKADKIIKLKK
ncbi:MAG: hypothetical protein PHP37_00375 [Patescibacteria group bacterium]|nr:hypothetical protein [Patescibacteria group bacterium]